jgi:hypothetical protein
MAVIPIDILLVVVVVVNIVNFDEISTRPRVVRKESSKEDFLPCVEIPEAPHGPPLQVTAFLIFLLLIVEKLLGLFERKRQGSHNVKRGSHSNVRLRSSYVRCVFSVPRSHNFMLRGCHNDVTLRSSNRRCVFSVPRLVVKKEGRGLLGLFERKTGSHNVTWRSSNVRCVLSVPRLVKKGGRGFVKSLVNVCIQCSTKKGIYCD